MLCANCDQPIEPDDGGAIWYHPENMSMMCDGDDSVDLTRQAEPVSPANEPLRVDQVDVYALIGQRLSERVAAVWPHLSEAEQEKYRTVDTEDEFRALLNEHERRLP